MKWVFVFTCVHLIQIVSPCNHRTCHKSPLTEQNVNRIRPIALPLSFLHLLLLTIILGQKSSRLINTGMGKVVLHPSQANFRVDQSTVQKSQRTSADSSPEPVHLHRASLLIPIPLRGCNSKAPDFFRPSVPNPRGSIQSPTPKSNVLKWCRLSHPATSSEDAMQYALLCISPSLPPYFTRKIHELGLNFDYSTWIDSCEST